MCNLVAIHRAQLACSLLCNRVLGHWTGLLSAPKSVLLSGGRWGCGGTLQSSHQSGVDVATALYLGLFVVANLVVAVGALALIRLLRLRGLLTNAIAFFVCFIGQITLSLLIAGVALASLGDGLVLLVNLLISAELVGASLRVCGPLTATEWGRPHAFVRDLARVLVGAPVATSLILVGLVA